MFLHFILDLYISTMSKLNLFVGVYSVIMIALFFTLCFLMTTVNPPPVKQDPEHGRKYGSDDYIYSNEVLTNDKVAYGLEKADDDYDSLDVYSQTEDKKAKSVPVIYADKNIKTNCTRKEILKMVTRSLKHIKGLRRSINKESQQEDEVPRAVHLKIKHLDGQPRIEIKLVPDKSKSKKIRKYRSSANLTNNIVKVYVDNDITKYVYDNISKEVIVIIENNEKIILGLGDSINLYDYNTPADVNDIIINDDELFNDKNISSAHVSTYKHHLVNSSSVKNIFEKVIMNLTESNQTNTEKTADYKSTMKSMKNEVKSVAISFNSVTFIETRNKLEFITNASSTKGTTSYFQTEDKSTVVTNPDVSSNTLVGLLIPEATATLPYNYHFIN